jgi:hypothetical protein
MPTLRFDASRFSRTKETKEGYLSAEAIVTRSGVFLYRNADGSVRRELRHPDDVFKKDSIDSMKMIPITDGHPESKLVNSKSAKSLQTGYVGENINIDGEFIRAPITITDSDSIAKIKNGKNQLSLGYTADVIKEDGEYNGHRYDCRQTNIRYNHLATVALARAGAEASISLDEGEAAQLGDSESFKFDDKNNNNNTRGKTMPKIIIDGIEYEAAAEVINAHKKSVAKLDALNAESEAKKGVADALADENKKMKAKLDEFDAKLAEGVNAAVKARIAIVDSAKSILSKEEKLDEMSNLDIKKAVILAVSKDAKLDDASEDYINARFDAAIEMNTERTDISDQRKTMGAKSGATGSNKSTLLDSQEKYLKRLQNSGSEK